MIIGSTEPRLWTPPLRELTPETSYGFEVIRFAREDLAHPLDPWEEFAIIHAGEVLPDGRPRFRIILILVARQNGKTELLVVLCLFWQFIEFVPLILGTSTKLDYSKESWSKTIKLVRKSPALAQYHAPGHGWYRSANGEQESWTYDDSRYKIAAANEEGGRGLTIGKLVTDELRQHHDYSAWEAAEPACSMWDSQIFGLSNAGDDRSVVLNDLRDSALEFVEWWKVNGTPDVAEMLLAGKLPDGMPDHRIGILEWSAPEDADPLDVHALAQANPNLGIRKDAEELLAKARRALKKGGEALTKFKTENMCIRVKMVNPAIESTAWLGCLEVGTLDGVRSRVAVCLDVAPDEHHATLTAAAVMADGRARVEPVKAWPEPGRAGSCTEQMWADMPALMGRIKPAARGWFPAGPAASQASKLGHEKGWEEIKSDTPAVCMGLAAEVKARTVVHSGDPLQDAHVTGAEKLGQPGGTWVFSRRGGHCDAAYAAAGAVHLARTLPPPVGKPRLIVVDD